MISVGKWAPLKHTAIVVLPRGSPWMTGGEHTPKSRKCKIATDPRAVATMSDENGEQGLRWGKSAAWAQTGLPLSPSVFRGGCDGSHTQERPACLASWSDPGRYWHRGR